MKVLLVFAVFTTLSDIAFVVAFPYLIVFATYLATKDEVNVNIAYHEKPIDATFKKLVMPSPDILYSPCRFDLSKADLLITVKVPNFTYWSASFYAINTDNFFTVN